MKISFDNSPQDRVCMEADGTLFAAFMATGYIQSVSRIRFSRTTGASIGAFSISEASAKEPGGDNGEQQVPQGKYALVFVSEADGNEKIAIIERFENERHAENALAMVHRAMLLWTRANRLKAKLRTVAVYALIPLMTFVFLASVMRALDARSASNDMVAAIVNQAGLMDGSGAAAGLPAMSADRPIAPKPTLKDSSFAKYGIRFGLVSAPPEKTLYVFSDPNCPGCKQFDGELKKLYSDHAVHIFPVTFKAGSDKLAAKALCAKDQAKKWQEVVNLPADGAVDGDDACEVAVKAIALNMAAFEQLGFTKTPTILTGEGQVFSNGPTAEQLRSATKLK